jgi:hypothetical protein
MSKIFASLIAFGLLLAPTLAAAQQVHVRGYVKKDGTYVQPHVRTSPNSTKADNYSSKGNVNPYTGKRGTVDPYTSPKPQTGSTKLPCYYNCK